MTTHNFEDSVMSEAMPVNSIAGLNRLIELLREYNTNSIYHNEATKGDWRIRAIIWWLMVQITDEQLGKVDMGDLYSEIETARQKAIAQ